MRFYKPRLREYVSTQVDMPWEFLQGVAEQKQKGYDAALAQGDAANKLLNFEVNPGDMPGKKHVQNEYNDQLYQITDYIRQTGDFNTASREFSKVLRNIAQDKRIQTMTAAVEPHKEVMKSLTSLMEKGAPELGLKADPMYSTYDPTTGALRPYNQRAGYDAREISTKMRTDFENAVDNVVADAHGSTSITGQFYVDSEGRYITREKLEPLIRRVLPTIYSSYSGYLNDLGDWDEKMGYKRNSTFDNLVESVINERIFTQTSKSLRENPQWGREQEQRLKEQSQLLTFTGQTTPVNINYDSAKQSIINTKNQIAALQKELENPETRGKLNSYQIQKKQQEIDQLRNNLNSLQTNIDLIHSAVNKPEYIDKYYQEYIKEFNTMLANNALYLPKMQQAVGKNGLKPLSKSEFVKYMKDEKKITGYTPWGKTVISPTDPKQMVNNIQMHSLGKIKYSYYEPKARELAQSGTITQEMQTIVDINPGSNLNQTSKAVKEGLFNRTLNARTSNNIGFDQILKDNPEANKEQSSITLVKNPITDQMSYQIILKDDKGKEISTHIVNINDATSREIKTMTKTSIKDDMTKSANKGNTEEFLNESSMLANIEYSEGLTRLRGFANEGKAITTPIKIGYHYIANAVDNTGKPIPDLFVMGQGYAGDDGKIGFIADKFEPNPNDKSTYILSYGDVENILGIGLYSR